MATVLLWFLLMMAAEWVVDDADNHNRPYGRKIVFDWTAT